MTDLTTEHLRILTQFEVFRNVLEEEFESALTPHLLLNSADESVRPDELVVRAYDREQWGRVYMSDLGAEERDAEAILVLDDVSFDVDEPGRAVAFNPDTQTWYIVEDTT